MFPKASLNPFLVRAFLRTQQLGTIQSWVSGLNPFLVRAFLRTFEDDYFGKVIGGVLIPF